MCGPAASVPPGPGSATISFLIRQALHLFCVGPRQCLKHWPRCWIPRAGSLCHLAILWLGGVVGFSRHSAYVHHDLLSSHLDIVQLALRHRSRCGRSRCRAVISQDLQPTYIASPGNVSTALAAFCMPIYITSPGSVSTAFAALCLHGEQAAIIRLVSSPISAVSGSILELRCRASYPVEAAPGGFTAARIMSTELVSGLEHFHIRIIVALQEF
jgi:hypothetical protein